MTTYIIQWREGTNNLSIFFFLYVFDFKIENIDMCR
jgi:hypothetical protein